MNIFFFKHFYYDHTALISSLRHHVRAAELAERGVLLGGDGGWRGVMPGIARSVFKASALPATVSGNQAAQSQERKKTAKIHQRYFNYVSCQSQS